MQCWLLGEPGPSLRGQQFATDDLWSALSLASAIWGCEDSVLLDLLSCPGVLGAVGSPSWEEEHRNAPGFGERFSLTSECISLKQWVCQTEAWKGRGHGGLCFTKGSYLGKDD